MRFGLIPPSFSFPDLDYAKAARLREFAVRAEALGYEALWVVEHLLTARGLYGTAWLSPLETVSFAAGCTSRIKLATGILIAALRNPVFVAKDIASLQYLSGGRFELGIGVGWDAHEYEVAGVPLRQRGGRTDEILQIFERLWTGEPVTHHGRYYQFEDVVIDPPLPRKAVSVARRRVEDQDRSVARSGNHGPDRLGADLPARGWLARARRWIYGQRHRRLGADPAAARRDRPPEGQHHLRACQFHAYRADRRRNRGIAGTAAVDRTNHGLTPLVRDAPHLLSARDAGADPGSSEGNARSRARIRRLIAARLRSRAARSLAGRNHPPLPEHVNPHR